MTWRDLIEKEETSHEPVERLWETHAESFGNQAIDKSTGRLYIHHLAIAASSSTIEAFLSSRKDDIDLNAYDDAGWTPLMIAASSNNSEALKTLILIGKVDLNLKSRNSSQSTALMYAISKGNMNCFKFLAENKANLKLRDSQKFTILHKAVATNNVDISRQIILLKIDGMINSRDIEGNTPLHLACEDLNQQLVILLLENGADPKLENSSQKTALQCIANFDAQVKFKKIFSNYV
ncbi:MAG: putative ankyrin-repeat protein [Marteilia pararefringens]